MRTSTRQQARFLARGSRPKTQHHHPEYDMYNVTEAESIALKMLGEPKGPRTKRPITIRHFSWETNEENGKS